MKPSPPTHEAVPIRKRKIYTKEFKQDAVGLAKQIGAKQAASDLGINSSMLRDWVRATRTEGGDAFRGQGNRTATEAEFARMRREISVLKQEREILKKAAEFWVKEQS
jgi:transposase